MEKVKKLMIIIRNGIAFIYSWLVICVIIVSLIVGQEIISVSFLLKLLALSSWAAICFAVCFRNQILQKKGFIFSLTAFYILFIPIEILMFYLMRIFQKGGTPVLWIYFFIIIITFYIISVLIDFMVMRKRAEVYTKKLREYNGM